MAQQERLQKKASTTVTGTQHSLEFLQTRPFGRLSKSDTTSRDTIQRKVSGNSSFGHSFGDVAVYPPTNSVIQPKLTIREPGDKYEQEADRVAAQVVQRVEIPEGEELQMKSFVQCREAIDGGDASTEFESSINGARGGGRSLDVGLQRSMGQTIGADFSRVQVHTDDIIQRAFIAVIGPEIPEGSTTLQEGAEKLKELHNEITYYDLKQIENKHFRSPSFDEDIYLIAHGDNPALTRTKEAALGGQNGASLAKIVKIILQKFVKDSNGEKFKGRIILEGCHTAEPILDEEKKKSIGGAMLYDLQENMSQNKFFDKNLAPEAKLGGYLGQAFSSGNYSNGYGTANTEHPLTIKFQKGRKYNGEIGSDGSISYSNDESYLESRWKKELPFGFPDGNEKKKKKKKK